MTAINPDTGNVAKATVTVSVRDMNAGESQANGISLLNDDFEVAPATATGSDTEASEVPTAESDNTDISSESVDTSAENIDSNVNEDAGTGE